MDSKQLTDWVVYGWAISLLIGLFALFSYARYLSWAGKTTLSDRIARWLLGNPWRQVLITAILSFTVGFIVGALLGHWLWPVTLESSRTINTCLILSSLEILCNLRQL